MKNIAINIVTKLMVVIMGLFVSSSVLAQNGNVREETARQVGLNFLRLKDGNPRSDLQLTRVDAVQYPNLYVYNTSENGFIVVASDNRMEPILAYSDEGTFDKDNVAPGANFWFEMYEYAIDSIVRNNVRDVDENITRKWDNLENGIMPELDRSGNYPLFYGPLIGTNWGQGDEINWQNNFNAMCPWVKKAEPNGVIKTHKAKTGCVATTLAQILNYYQVDISPRRIWYSFRHRGNDVLDFYGSQSEGENGCYLPIRESYIIGGWNNLTGMNRIAKMMIDCGLAVDMKYGLNESSAKCPNIFACPYESSQESALKQIFGFPDARVYRRFYNGTVSWDDLLKEQIYNNNPVIYDGRLGNGRHNFICDGYYDNWFHFNFGWCGSSNGYYLNTVVFPSDQIAIVLNPVDMEIENDVITMGQTLNKPWCNGSVTIRPGEINGHNNELIIYNEPGVYGLRNFCRDSNKTLIWNVKVLPNDVHKVEYDNVCKRGEYRNWFSYSINNGNDTVWFALSREQTNFDGTRSFVEPILDAYGNSVGTCTLNLTTSGVVHEVPDTDNVSFCYLLQLAATNHPNEIYYPWDIDGDGIEELKCYASGRYEYVVKTNPYDCETVYYLDLTIEDPNSPIREFDTTTCINNIVWKTDRFPDLPINRNINEYGKKDWYQWDNNCDNVYVLHWYYAEKDTIPEEVTKCVKDLPFEWHGQTIDNRGPGFYNDFSPVLEPKDPNDPTQCDKVYLLYLTVTEDCCTQDPECIKDKIAGNSKSTSSNMETIYYGLKHYYEHRDATNDFLFNVFNGISWPSMEERNTFWNLFQSLLDSNTGMMSEEAMQQLIATNPYDYITEEYITDLVERYNRSAMYWNEGLYSIWHLPQGYDLDFIEYDTASMNKAYEAYDYAIAHGFSDVRAMYDNAYELLAAEVDNIQSSVCARVTVQFNQKMTMTREAFNGTLQIFNGHESIPMEDIFVDFRIEDQQGNDCTNLFQINTLSLDQITGISGDGSLAAQTNGTALVQFIPTRNAAPTQPTVYYFGGSFSFIDPFTGEGLTYPLYPVDITVNPSPDLYVDYFMQRDILGDDALTLGVVEPSIPAELGVIIHNKGAGIAKNVTLETAEPEIIDNEHGLAIEFAMYGASFNGNPRQLGLMEIPFGNIESGQTAVGEWLFTSSLLGHFVSYTAHVIHNSSYDNPDLSLVSHLDIHELVHPIYAYGNLDDGINDFLVNDNPDVYDTPDSIYFSHGGKTSVGVVNGISFDHYVSPSDTIVTLTVVPSRIGWNYGVTDDPGMNEYEIVSCIRNDDNQVIPLNNVWQTFVTIPDGGDPVYENKLHIVDTIPVQQTTTYTLVFAKSANQNNSVAQATTLTEGWNWWSSYIDMATEQDFNKLKTALGSNASMIKSRTDGFVTYMGGWYGTLQTINNQNMYMINMNSEQTISITGTLANLASNPITINNGWNWIGYPANVSVDINSALVNMTPTESDLIKTRNAFATYYSSMGGWFGSLTSLTPGMGYMYQSNNDEQFEFVYSTITRTDIESFEVQMTNHWEISVGEYSDNATLIGVIAINGEEQRNENLIIGAFINDRCVGEANAVYIEPFDRYLVFLTYFGNENDPITFRLYDENTGIETIGSETSLVFNANSMIGSLEEPLVINFTMTTNVDEFAKNAKLFPNPVKAMEKVNVGLKNVDASSMKIEIVNTLGMVVYQKTYHSTAIDITAPRLPGIYIVKITEDNGNVYYGKLIVE